MSDKLKKSKTQKETLKQNIPNNFVAKNAHKFNTARVFKDKKNDYERKPKHRRNGVF
jgi:hypothetical protein